MSVKSFQRADGIQSPPEIRGIPDNARLERIASLTSAIWEE